MPMESEASIVLVEHLDSVVINTTRHEMAKVTFEYRARCRGGLCGMLRRLWVSPPMERYIVEVIRLGDGSLASPDWVYMSTGHHCGAKVGLSLDLSMWVDLVNKSRVKDKAAREGEPYEDEDCDRARMIEVLKFYAADAHDSGELASGALRQVTAPPVEDFAPPM